MKIILDTNFLIGMMKHKVADQLKELNGKLILPETVEKELSKSSLGGKEKELGAAALSLVEKWKISKTKSEKDMQNVDDSIVNLVKKYKSGDSAGEVYVATLDKELASRVKEAGGKILSISRGKFVRKL